MITSVNIAEWGPCCSTAPTGMITVEDFSNQLSNSLFVSSPRNTVGAFMTENRSHPLERPPAERSYRDGGATRTGSILLERVRHLPCHETGLVFLYPCARWRPFQKRTAMKRGKLSESVPQHQLRRDAFPLINGIH